MGITLGNKKWHTDGKWGHTASNIAPKNGMNIKRDQDSVSGCVGVVSFYNGKGSVDVFFRALVPSISSARSVHELIQRAMPAHNLGGG